MPTALPFPTDSTIHRLQAAQGDPMVSVLLRTTPAAVLEPAEAATLTVLVDHAVERVRGEAGEDAAEELGAALRRLARQAAQRPASRGLALFAGGGLAEGYRLPVAVRSRTVVDPTFATRDLVRALAEHPPYRVLVLGAGEARLHIGANDELTEVNDGGFPLLAEDEDGDRRGHLLDPERSHRRTVSQERFLRQVDARVSGDRILGHLPLFVVAAEPTLGLFRKLTRTDPAGVVRGNHLRTARGRLAALVRPAVQEHVRRTAQRDLERLTEVDRTPGACRGIDAVWAGAVTGRVHLLLVEQAYTYPGVLADGGMRLERVQDPEAPGALDDAIDELIEIVQRSDGAVRFVPTDTLDGGVAALLRGAA
jgi:hypothetical protein